MIQNTVMSIYRKADEKKQNIFENLYLLFFAMTGVLLTGCGSKKKNAEDESVIKISTVPEPTVTVAPQEIDPSAVTTNGSLKMVNEYLAENGGEALGITDVTPTPAASDGSADSTGDSGSDTSDNGEGAADGE